MAKNKDLNFRIKDIKYPEPVLKLKKALLNFKHQGIGLWIIMMQEANLHFNYKKESGNIFTRFLKIIRYLFFQNKSKIIGAGKNKILIVYTLPRKAYHNLIKEFLKDFKEKELITIDEYYLKQKNIIKRIKFRFPDFRLIFKIYKFFKENSLYPLIKSRSIFFTAQTYYKCKQIEYCEEIIKKYNPKAYISISSSFGEEAIFMQLFHKYKKPTFHTQHGLYAGDNKFSSTTCGLESLITDYILTWGEKSSEFFKKFTDSRKILLVGNPEHKKLINKSKKFEPKKGTVFLTGDEEKKSNFELIKIVNKLSKKYPEIKFYFKLHPTTKNITFYKKKIQIKNSDIIVGKIIPKSLLDQSDFVITQFSSVYLEALKYQIPIFRYKVKFENVANENNWFFGEGGNTFENSEDLQELFKNMFNFKKYMNCLRENKKMHNRYFYQPKNMTIPKYYKKVINEKIGEYYKNLSKK